jgi:hypothetical protein
MLSMRDVLKSIGGRLPAGWFWPLVLLALPNCTLDNSGLPNPFPFNPGSGDLSFAVMCEIPKVPDPNNPENCADGTEALMGMSRANAAIALAQGEHNSLALDFSADAKNACAGSPRKSAFYAEYPVGFAVCLNCPQMIGPGPSGYADSKKVCEAKCKELVSVGGPEPPGGAEAYCQANATVATNFAKNECYAGACTPDGVAILDYPDPRKQQVPIKWDELIGASAPSNTLTRTAPTDGLFSGGGTSDRQTQRIQGGDAWIEFEASETNKGHVLGVSHDSGGNDVDPSFSDIGFGISLDADHNVYILEGGVVVLGAGGTLGTYEAGDRFRVYVTDNNDVDHTATISYYKVDPGCVAGTKCTKNLIANQQTNPSPKYPLRVDAALGDVGAALANVTMVFIHPVAP